MSGRIEARLKETGIELPLPGAPVANYVPFTISGNLVFIAGQLCVWNGERRYVGKLGAGVGTNFSEFGQQTDGLNNLFFLKRHHPTRPGTPTGSIAAAHIVAQGPR